MSGAAGSRRIGDQNRSVAHSPRGGGGTRRRLGITARATAHGPGGACVCGARRSPARTHAVRTHGPAAYVRCGLDFPSCSAFSFFSLVLRLLSNPLAPRPSHSRRRRDRYSVLFLLASPRRRHVPDQRPPSSFSTLRPPTRIEDTTDPLVASTTRTLPRFAAIDHSTDCLLSVHVLRLGYRSVRYSRTLYTYIHTHTHAYKNTLKSYKHFAGCRRYDCRLPEGKNVFFETFAGVEFGFGRTTEPRVRLFGYAYLRKRRVRRSERETTLVGNPLPEIIDPNGRIQP